MPGECGLVRTITSRVAAQDVVQEVVRGWVPLHGPGSGAPDATATAIAADQAHHGRVQGVPGIGTPDVVRGSDAATPA